MTSDVLPPNELYLNVIYILKWLVPLFLLPIARLIIEKYFASKFSLDPHIEPISNLMLNKEKYSKDEYRFLLELLYSKYLKINIPHQVIESLLKCDSPLAAVTIFAKAKRFIKFDNSVNKFTYQRRALIKIPFSNKKYFSPFAVVIKGFLWYLLFSLITIFFVQLGKPSLSNVILNGSYNMVAIVNVITLMGIAGFSIGLGLKIFYDYMSIILYSDEIEPSLSPYFKKIDSNNSHVHSSNKVGITKKILSKINKNI